MEALTLILKDTTLTNKIIGMKTHSLFLISIVMIACSSTKTVVLEKYSKEIVFIDKTDEYYENGNLRKCKLSDTAAIEGFCCISWLHLYENGSIKQFRTTKDIEQPTYIIPSGSVIFPIEKDIHHFKCVRFSKDVNIDSVLCKGGNEVEVNFYPNGKIESCFLSKNQTIHGFPCKSSLLKPVRFYQDGKVKELTLSKDYELQGTLFQAGSTVTLDANGTISKI